MIEVTKEQFYDAIGELNVALQATGKYPYITEFRLKDGTLLGKVINDYTGGILNNYPIVSRYMIIK